jgi:pimeloyl-ACP methyl ester carboxylesterase
MPLRWHHRAAIVPSFSNCATSVKAPIAPLGEGAVSAVVVYVHGLWLNGWEATWLRRRLSRQLGCSARLFHYASVTADVTANVRALGGYLAEMQVETVHLVAHSMGGALILDFFEHGLWSSALFKNGRPLAPGRIVLLGSPVRGSSAAQRLAKLPLGRTIMGATAAHLLLAPPAWRWSGARDLGIIAGDMPFGFGRLVGKIDAPNDGTILVEETRLTGAKEHLTLPVTHSGMVLSAAVARQTASFLRHGRFER